jgi:hypothetical protein
MLVTTGSRKCFVLVVGIVGLAGCGQGGGRERNPTEERLYKIGKAYVRSCHDNGLGPAAFGDIKSSIEGDFLDDLLISPNAR